MVEQARFCAYLCPLINDGASKISLACSFSVSYHIESQRMFQNQVEKEKVERERELEKVIWNQVEKEKEGSQSGYTCVVEKKQEKKKHMDEIEKKNNIKNKI